MIKGNGVIIVGGCIRPNLIKQLMFFSLLDPISAFSNNDHEVRIVRLR